MDSNCLIQQKVLRTALTKTVNDLDTYITENNFQTASLAFAKLEEKSKRLFAIDKIVFKYLSSNPDDQTDDTDEEEALKTKTKSKSSNVEEILEKELEECENYRDHYISAKVRFQDFTKSFETENKSELKSSDRISINLPKLELTEFDGNPKNWFSFWAMFQKIDEDPKIEDDVKFAYLIQTTKGKAFDFVQSYQVSKSEYKSVIKNLKARFADDKMLIELYVRELLKLILNQSQNMSFINLVDQLDTQLRCLENLGVTKEKYACMLYPLVEASIPENILIAWERERNSRSSNEKTHDLELLMQFLRNEVIGSERIRIAKNFCSADKNKTGKKEIIREAPVATASSLITQTKTDKRKTNVFCLFCQKNTHRSCDCFTAQKMSLQERKDKVIKMKACLACLRINCRTDKCGMSVRCIVCSKKHFPILCPNLCKEKEESFSSLNKTETNSVVSNSSSGSADVLLQTLQIRISGPSKTKVVRCLFDSASQRSYISRDVAEFLNLKTDHSEFLTHSLFGGIETEKIKHSALKCELHEIRGNFSCEVLLLDKEIICGTIPKINKSDVEYFTNNGIYLSDSENDYSNISVLIGADYLGKLLTGCISQQPNGLTAVQTYLGWVVMGKPVSCKTNSTHVMPIISLLSASKICDLWSLDILGIRDPVENKTKTEIDTETLAFFEKTVKYSDGRYEVNLPWVEGHPELCDLKLQSEKRLNSMTSKLISSGNFDSYDKIFREWEQMGIIQQVPSNTNGENLSDVRCRYLPHRAVFKESSLTTKIRPVFDASSKDENSVSLNQCLATGPNYIELIPSILNKFRKYKIGVISDIRKAFLQIRVCHSDRDFLRFLWWDDFEKRKIKIYRHCRVVFGLSSSPFLLMATIYHHLNKIQGIESDIAVKLRDAFYVDNVVASVENESELERFSKTACKIMSQAGFELTGWVSSSQGEKQNLDVNEYTYSPVLGLLWQPNLDTISCDVSSVTTEINNKCTKRQLLSISQKIFDPIGFTAPVTLIPKILMQRAWKNEKLGWDNKLPMEIVEEFKNWLSSIEFLKLIQIPRYFGGLVNASTTSIHMFCDASGKAFAACVFLRIECENKIQIRLVQAKSRVAPLKKDPITKIKTEMSIPKLELLAALIGSRLVKTVKTSLKISDVQTFYWTDSKVVLCWIKNPGTWKTFVNNRIQEIHSNSLKEEWCYIPSQMNAADIASRGCNAQTLFTLRWWEGPAWLKNRDSWPDTQNSDFSEALDLATVEKKPTITTNLSLDNSEPNFFEWTKRISKFSKIVRVLAYVQRFISNAKSAINNQTESILSGNLTAEELSKSELEIALFIQRETFGKNRKLLPPNFIIYHDSNGLFRVETKLVSTSDSDYFRRPILLPDKHELVFKLIEETHRTYNHVGVQTLVTTLREKYWILRSRKTVRSVVSKCAVCQRFKSKSATTMFAPLPEERVRMSAVFETTGIDLAGPLILRNHDKVWVSIFTCAVYRAVHFELVTDISTQSFLLALRRFISRRGRVKTIYSDNGSNFVGANNELKNIDWKTITAHSDLKRISWLFIPPTGAWWGGWWERVVRMLKELLRRNLGKACLDHEELYTVVCECEALLNSRPLTYLSEEPSDLVPLTPSLFLQDQTEFCVEDLDQNDVQSLRKRAKHLHSVKQKLKTRFYKEYISLLKHSKHVHQTPLEVGDMVLIGSDNKKRVDWPLAKIIEIYKGRDGVSRVARLKTQNGEIVRPFQRLFRLETTGIVGKTLRSVRSAKM